MLVVKLSVCAYGSSVVMSVGEAHLSVLASADIPTRALAATVRLAASLALIVTSTILWNGSLLDTIREKLAYKIWSVNSALDRNFIVTGQSLGGWSTDTGAQERGSILKAGVTEAESGRQEA